MFTFDHTKLVTDELIGSGQYGWVYPYRKDQNDDRWVVKHLFAKNFDTFLVFMQEIVLGFNCEHPSLLPIKGYYVKGSLENPGWNLYIKMPKMDKTLKHIMNQHLRSDTLIPEEQIVKYFYSLSSGLEYLHNRKIAHRDIKPTNILIDKQGNVKLADIGIAKFVPEDETSYLVNDIAGTPLYSAPETSNNPQLKKKDLYKADAWSLGVVIADLCLLKTRLIDSGRPLSNEDRHQKIKEKLQGLEGKYSKALIGLIEELLNCDIGERKTVSHVKKVLEEHYSEVLGIKKEPIFEESKIEMMADTLLTESLADLPERIGEFEEVKKALESLEDCKLEDKIVTMADLEIVKKEIHQKWRDIFEFKPNEFFSIRKVDSKRVTDQGIKCFMKDIEMKLRKNNCKGIHQMSFSFQGCKQITDQGLKELGTQIGTNYKKVHSLAFNFYGCEQIKDQGIKDLISQISLNLKDLQNLSLGFHSCKQITDKGVKELTTIIGRDLKNIKNLALDFGFCKQITDQAKISLKNAMTSIAQSQLN